MYFQEPILTTKTVSKLIFDCSPRLMALMRSEVRHQAQGSLTIPQLRVLAHLNRNIGQISQLSELQGVSQPAMSKIVKGLEQRSFLSRISNRDDRRCSHLSLTSLGRETFNRIKKLGISSFSKKLSRFSSEELKEVESAFVLIEKFLNKLEQGEER